MRPLACLFGRHVYGPGQPSGTLRFLAEVAAGREHPPPPADFGFMEHFCLRCDHEDSYQEDNDPPDLSFHRERLKRAMRGAA